MASGALRRLFLHLGVEVDERGVRKAESGLDKIRKVAGVVAAVFITGAIARGFRTLINDASEAGETANKFAAVFGDASEAVQKRLDDTSKRTGNATLQLQQFASQIGALVKPSLGSAEAAGEMGAQMAELAYDISSFNDVDPEEALGALRAGLIGSAEPLQRFGIDVRTAAIEAEALRQGISKSYKNMKEGERILLRQSVILRSLTTQGALGDATKTAASFANASRALNSQIKMLRATLGSFVIGSISGIVLRLQSLVQTTNDWIQANRELIQSRIGTVIESLGRVFGGVWDALKMIVGAYAEFVDGMSRSEAVIFNLTVAFAALWAMFGLPVVLFGIIGAAIYLLIDDLVTLGEGGESVIGTLIEGFTGLIDELGGVDEAILEVLATTFGLAGRAAEEFKAVGRLVFRFFDNIGRALVAMIAGPVNIIASLMAGDFKSAREAMQTMLSEGALAAVENFAMLMDPASALQAIGGLAPAQVQAAPGVSNVARTNVSTTVQVDARGARNPDAVGVAVGREVDAVMDKHLHEASEAFAVGGG
jgi:hypothetical protein